MVLGIFFLFPDGSQHGYLAHIWRTASPAGPFLCGAEHHVGKALAGLLVCLTREGSQTLPAPPQPFEPGDFYLPGGYFVKFQVVKYEDFLKNQPIFKKDLNCCADCAKIQGNVILRTRQPGDFFRPAGRHLRKTLKKYYNELGIPQAERPLLPLLADGSEVLWLWGCGFAEGCAPDEYTHEVLTVRTEKTGEA